MLQDGQRPHGILTGTYAPVNRIFETNGNFLDERPVCAQKKNQTTYGQNIDSPWFARQEPESGGDPAQIDNRRKQNDRDPGVPAAYRSNEAVAASASGNRSRYGVCEKCLAPVLTTARAPRRGLRIRNCCPLLQSAGIGRVHESGAVFVTNSLFLILSADALPLVRDAG
jgi:hypothetical protein